MAEQDTYQGTPGGEEVRRLTVEWLEERNEIAVLRDALEVSESELAEAREHLPALDADEREAMDLLLAAYNKILGWRLRANSGELTQAVHTIQGFIIQHMLQRIDPDHWSAWFGGDHAQPGGGEGVTADGDVG